MAIIQWNCDGFLYHLGEVKNLISQYNPYVMCFQETHFNKFSDPKLKGFSVNYKNVDDPQRACGGVAIFVKLNFHSIDLVLNTSLQAVATTIFVPSKMTICNIYLPPGRPFSFLDLDSLVAQLPCPFILCGDFNAHNIIWGSTRTDSRGRIIENLINRYDLNIFNDGSKTHFSTAYGTFSAIDTTFATPSLHMHFDWKTHSDLCSSDHFPIVISPIKKIVCNRRSKWKINEADWTKFQNNTDNECVNYNNNIEENIKNITSNILSAAKSSIPFSSGKPKRVPVPWWSAEVAEAIKNRKRALRIFTQYPTQVNLANFRKLRAKARKVIRSSMKISWENFVSSIDVNTSSKTVWNKIKSISGKHTYSSITSLNINGQNETLINTIATSLGTFFQTNSSSNLYSLEFRRSKHRLESVPIDIDSDGLESFNKLFSMSELEIAIKKSKGSSPGPDNIHYDMIKNLPFSMKQQLLDLYNEIWQNHEYPDAWRQALVVPIPKPHKNLTELSSYRPISLTCCLSKILQRMVNFRLVWKLETDKRLQNFQNGFRKFRSTLDNHVILESHINEAFANKQHLVAVFLDLEKAYDTTWKHIILKTLSDWNIRGHMLYYIRNFLYKRVFRISIADYISEEFEVENGVPQGEILSVVLFLIALNTLENYIPPDVKILIYADDITIYFSSKCILEIENKLQNALSSLELWANESGFRFSSLKTTCVHFTKLRKHFAKLTFI